MFLLLFACATSESTCDSAVAATADSPSTDDTGSPAEDTDPCAWVDETIDDFDFSAYAPVVICTNPRVGAMDADPALTEIRVTFSKEMMDGSWSWVQFDRRSFPETTGDAYYATARTNVLPVALEADHTYQLWLNYDEYDNFGDIDGNSAVPYQLTFKTR